MKLEDNLEKEKKHRADVEKNKRKLETDLKSTQETLEELDRVKRELEETVRRYFLIHPILSCQFQCLIVLTRALHRTQATTSHHCL